MKKTLLSILISILITTSIVTAVFIVNIYRLQFDSFSLIINASMPEHISENTINELKGIETFAYSFTEPMYKEFPSTTPVLGYNIAFSLFQITNSITNIYITAIILGLLIGLFYDLFHNKKYTGKKFLVYTLTAIVTIAVIAGLSNLILGNSLLSNTEIPYEMSTLLDASSTLFNLSALLIVLLAFIWAYVGNYIRKSIEIKHLNQELDVPLNRSSIIKVVIVGLVLTAIVLFAIMYNIGIIYF